MDLIPCFLSDNYGKLTTSALLCFLVYKNYRFQQNLIKLTKQNNVALKQLIAIEENLKNVENIKEEYLSDVIFFEGRVEDCADHVIQNYECPLSTCPAYKVRKIVSYIDSAKTSLDLCLCLISNKTLGNAFLQARKRGVTIRVITDGDFAFASGSQIVRFIDKNIPIQVAGPPYIMHQKFVIIDSTLVLHGSMNWTTQAVSGNYEHVEVTGNPALVRMFQNFFDTLFERLSAKNGERWWEKEEGRKDFEVMKNEGKKLGEKDMRACEWILSEREKECEHILNEREDCVDEKYFKNE